MNAATLEGRLDAIFATAPPRASAAGDKRVRRLMDPAGPWELDYFKRTQIFPPMHILGIKKP